jgi:hypothetical protein
MKELINENMKLSEKIKSMEMNEKEEMDKKKEKEEEIIKMNEEKNVEIKKYYENVIENNFQNFQNQIIILNNDIDFLNSKIYKLIYLKIFKLKKKKGKKK